MSRPKIILSMLVALVIGGGLVLGLTRDRSANPAIIEGVPLEGTKPAAMIAGPDLVTGKRLDIADFKGRPVFVNLWASWCGPCREEAPELVRFAKAHPEITVIGLNMNDDRKLAREFSAKAGWTYPSIYDPNGVIGVDRLKIANLPDTIYIDANGIERGRTTGPVTFEELENVAKRI